MILHTQPIENELRIEIVNGLDIMESYRNNSKVASCMSNHGRWKRTKFYSKIPDLSMMRIMHDETLMLRALIWNSTDVDTGLKVKYMDKVYYKSYPYDLCDGDEQIPSLPYINDLFLKYWTEFADVRSTNKRLEVEVEPHRYTRFPSVDRFNQYNPQRLVLTNTYMWNRDGNWKSMTDHETGLLKP